MTRREILEKNWKDFILSTGLEYEPMSDKAYEYMENAMEQYAELRLGAVVGQSGQCSGCKESTGETRLWCCNHCGKRIEDF